MDEEDRYTRITLRIPRDLHAALSDAAEATSKSMNAEIVARLQASFEPDAKGGDAAVAMEFSLAKERFDRLKSDFAVTGLLSDAVKMLLRVAEHQQPADEELRQLVESIQASQEAMLSEVQADLVVSQYNSAVSKVIDMMGGRIADVDHEKPKASDAPAPKRRSKVV